MDFHGGIGSLFDSRIPCILLLKGATGNKEHCFLPMKFLVAPHTFQPRFITNKGQFFIPFCRICPFRNIKIQELSTHGIPHDKGDFFLGQSRICDPFPHKKRRREEDDGFGFSTQIRQKSRCKQRINQSIFQCDIITDNRWRIAWRCR